MKYKDAKSLFDQDQKRFQQMLRPLDSALSVYQRNFISVRDNISKHETMLKSTVSSSELLRNQLLETINQTQNILNNSLIPAMKSVSVSRIDLNEAISPILKSVAQNQRTLAYSIDPFIAKQNKLFKNITRQLSNIAVPLPQNRAAAVIIDSSRINELMTSFRTTLSQAALNIDFTGLDELDITINSEEANQAINIAEADLPGSILVTSPKKKLIDMTEEDLINLLKRCINPKTQAFSLLGFIYALYSDYVNEAARILIEIMLVVCCSLLTGHYDAEVKAAIKERVMETTTVKDLRKVITKYVKFNPYGQLAFVRKDSYLRKGSSKNAPLVTKTKITSKTPLTILDRRSNWLKVEIDDGDYHGEIGWVQESAVVKYKRVK